MFGTSDAGLYVNEYAVTDIYGVANFYDVLQGDYILEEVNTPPQYVVPSAQNVKINWNEVTLTYFDNALKKFRVDVQKSDKETETSQGNASLSGAVYGIYKGDQLIDRYTTDNNGRFTTTDYICGNDWTIREISPSEGYLLDRTVYPVGAEAEQYTLEYNSTANDVFESVIKGNIAIIKHSNDGSTQIETPEVGAEFEVFLKSAGGYNEAKPSEKDLLVCDENGFAKTKDLPYGIYTVKQTKGWEGNELMSAFDVYIAKNDQTYRYLINNATFESYLKVIKIDAETGNVIPYAGAGFQLYDPNGNLITQSLHTPHLLLLTRFIRTRKVI